MNAQLGLAIVAAALPVPYAEWLAHVQSDLLDLGADLSLPEVAESASERLRLLAEQVAWLEERCDEVNASLAPLRSFVLPGGTLAAAQLHVCRSVCRRAERHAVLVTDSNPEILRYLNRLSDLLFILSRAANAPSDEPLWQPGLNR